MSTRGRPPKLGTSFDRLIKQQSQKGRFGIGGSKSSGIVQGKWGSTSFTSLKKVNGIGSKNDQSITQQTYNVESGIGVGKKREWTSSEITSSVNNASAVSNVPRPKKFFKSRDATPKLCEQTQPINTGNASEMKLHSTSRSVIETGIETSFHRNKSNASIDENTAGLDSQVKSKSNKRNKTTKEPSPALVTNQLQEEETLPKKSNKKFFTSKQRKQERNTEKCNITPTDNMQPDIVEDRENLPRVPPLKLRLKAANAAALSIESFTKPEEIHHGQLNKNNNNGLRNEVTDHSASIKEDFDVQPNTLLNRSEPDMQCKVQTEDDLKLKPEIHSAAKESLRPRRGRKQNENQSQNTVENSNRKNNGIDKLQEDEKSTDVTDVAGGTRQHRKVMLNALPLNEPSEQTIDTAKNTRSTRSSRLRGPSRNTVNYNEEKSDEYLDALCDSQLSQKQVITETKDNEAFNLATPLELEGNNAKNSPEGYNTNFLNDKDIMTQPSVNEKQSDSVSTLSNKDWTLDDVDQFYTKCSEEGINESANDSLEPKLPLSKENESTDANFRTYTRKRKDRQVEVNDKSKDFIDSIESRSLESDDNAVRKSLDERVPNQHDITKMAATATSNPISNLSSMNDTATLKSKEHDKQIESCSDVSSSKSSDAFSIKVLADIKEDEEIKKPSDVSYESVYDSNSQSLERNNSSQGDPNDEKRSNKEEDYDFYSKLMDNKSQVNQKLPVKSFSLGNKQSNNQSASNIAAGSNIVKKRSIFKSKALANSNAAGGSGNGNQVSQGSKGRSLYKHKWSANNEDAPQEEPSFRAQVLQRALTMPAKSSSLDFDDNDFGEKTAEIPFSANRLVRVPTVTGGSSSSSIPGFDETLQEVVSVKCPKDQKTFYQVIKKTKKAHQIQDSGEFQEFNDDVEYIQEGLGKHNNLSTRCLSTVTLASKCMEPPFRMHLRAHGTVTKFFQELKDAPDNPSLALCTSTVLFVLSQDRLNMDLDRESLELMLNLLDTDSRIKDALDGAGLSKRELEKNKAKVQELVGAMKAKGRATNLSLDHISADHLAMETLLSMTSKRAGEWFKEELRELGGLDHLVRTMSDCLAFLTADDISMWTDPLLNKLKKSDRVLKVLESVTHENEENCQYLLEYQGGKFLDCIHSFFKLLDEEVPLNSSVTALSENPVMDKEDKESVAYTLRESLLDVIRVYINLVHDYKSIPHGSRLSGEKEDIFDICLHGMFVLPTYIPEEKRFDVLVLILTLIINLVENCKPNRGSLMKAFIPDKTDDMFTNKERQLAPEGLIRMFLEREENAKRLETKTDKILDGKEDEDEGGSKQPKEGNDKTDENSGNKTCEEDNLVVTRKPSDTHASYGSRNKSKPAENAKGNKSDSGSNSNSQKSHEEFIDETVKKLLEKAGSHMEDTLVASYLTLIIGYLIHENPENETIVRQWLPENNFTQMVAVLKKFYNFMNLTASASVASTRGLKATEMILKYMEKVDKAPEEKKDDLKVARSSIDMQEETFDDLTLFDVTKDEDDDLDDISHTGSRSDRSRNSESSFLDMKSPNFDDFGKL